MKLRELRIKNNLTQKDFAEKLDISRSTVAMWEKGSSAPRYSMVSKIAAVLNVSKEVVLNCFCDDEDASVPTPAMA